MMLKIIRCHLLYDYIVTNDILLSETEENEILEENMVEKR